MKTHDLGMFAALILTLMFAGHVKAGDKEAGHSHEGSIGTSSIERPAHPERPTLIFYKLPHCGICTRIDSWLVKLDKEHADTANYVRKNSTDSAIHPEMNSRGIHHHGVVIMDPGTNVLWAAQAHGLEESVLVSAFRSHVLASSESSSE